MKRIVGVAVWALACGAVTAEPAAPPPATQPEAAAPALKVPIPAPALAAGKRDDSAAERIGFRLAVQAYTFNRYTFFEAIDKTASLGIRYIEGYPGQRVSKDINARLGPALSPEQRKAVKEKLAAAGVKLVNFGVTGADKATFDFARDMGIETIVSESYNKAAELDKLCAEYGINVALHNHPGRQPQTVLDAAKGLSKRIGACADTGHWMRTKIVPMDGIKLLAGRIVCLHFKDLDKMGGGHDVPWGAGAGDVKAVLAELHRQGFRGVFSVEYEYNWTNSVPEIARCVEFFDKTCAELLAQDQANKKSE